MPGQKIIRHEIHGQQIRPVGAVNNRTPVGRGDVLVFVPPAGSVSGSVTFDASSPFGGNSISYPATVTVPQSAAAGVYVYSCLAVGADGVALSSAGGGEVEVGNS